MRAVLLYLAMAALIAIVGLSQSWNTALAILNMCVLSAIVALGVNMQWGYAGLFNIGIMGFIALGALAPVLVSMPPSEGAWGAGGYRIVAALLFGAALIWAAIRLWRRMPPGALRVLALLALLVAGFFLSR